MSPRLCAALFFLTVLLGCGTESDQVTFQTPSFSKQGSSPDNGRCYSDWSAPVNLGAPISFPGVTTTGPALSADGLSLYFSANRPGSLGTSDIWVSQRASRHSPWQTPVNLGVPINSTFSQSLPVLSADGHLLFISTTRPGGGGGTDLWVSHRKHTHDDFAWEAPVPLGPGVNTPGFEAAPSYSPNAGTGGTNLYFSKGPAAGSNLGIYSAAIKRNGETLGPAVEVAALNALPLYTTAHPSLSKDGREVFVYSTRLGGFGSQDIWTSTRPNIHSAWSTPVNLGPTINTAGIDVHPTVSFDGLTLLWSSNRAGTIGVRDLWMSTRTRCGHGDSGDDENNNDDNEED